MFRYAALLAPLAPLCCAAEQSQQAPALPATHQEFIPALLELLEQTEQSLASCTDAASCEAAVPRLKELAARARQLSAHQQSLPEPTVQDYIAAHPHIAQFTRLWEAVSAHIERLEQTQLITPEMRNLLQLAPKAG